MHHFIHLTTPYGTVSYRHYISEQSAGVNINNLRAEHLLSLEISLPPLAEQQRIVAKIEELMARSRAARTALAEVPTLLEQFRQSVLASAFRGNLTADWRAKNPDTEPASKLLERIRNERRKQWEAKYPKKAYVEADAVDDTDLPELPADWCWATLGQVGSVERGRFLVRPRNDPSYFTGSYPFVQIGDLPPEGGDIRRYEQTLNEKGLSVSRMFPSGTALIAIVGATIGNTGLLTFDSCCPDSLVGIQAATSLQTRYVELYMRSKKLEIRRASYASGGQPNINLQTLLPYPIPLPPEQELTEIVSQVDRSIACADRQCGYAEAAVVDLDMCDQSILAKAFRGELVTQDPTDEPAAALLARIRSGGSATTPTTLTRSAKRGQVRAYILLLLRTWNKPLGREMLERGLVLMLNADVRRAILGRSKTTAKRTKKNSTPPRFVSGMDALLGEMIADRWLVPGPEAGFFAEGQHGIDFTAAPPSDLDAVRETAEAMKVLHKDKQQATDADIVSALNGEIYELVY